MISRRRIGGPRGLAGSLLLATCAAVPAAGAQTVAPPPPPTGSLQTDPQTGATPRPIAPSAPIGLPPRDGIVAPPPSPPPTPAPLPRVQGPAIPLQPLRGALPDAATDGVLPRRQVPGGLPLPSATPLTIDPASDPILRLALPTADPAAFYAAIRQVVERNPAAAEAEARRDESEAVRNEARAQQYPVIDVQLSHFRVLDRAFSNDPQNVLERSRPRLRTDGIVRAQQPVIDFGTARNRIGAGNRRIEAQTASIDDAAQQIALRGIATWYQLFGYRALVQLASAFVESQTGLRGAIQQRVTQGFAAPGDVAQVDSYIAAAEAQLASYRRQLASAEAQYLALTGEPAPAGFGRAPAGGETVDRARVIADAEGTPAVRAARSFAEAARYDVRAVRADAMPGVTAGVDAGRYGVFETRQDFDIRGTVTFSHRFGGGAIQRIDQSEARSRGAEAAYQRVRQDAVRDAEIALADVESIQATEAAIRANYLATRQSRDVLAERFRVARGTLFDLLGAEANYFNVAARYVETVTELDIARYSLLARRGRLLRTFGIEPARLDRP